MLMKRLLTLAALTAATCGAVHSQSVEQIVSEFGRLHKPRVIALIRPVGFDPPQVILSLWRQGEYLRARVRPLQYQRLPLHQARRDEAIERAAGHVFRLNRAEGSHQTHRDQLLVIQVV